MQNTETRLTHAELLELRRWNTPTIFNGWEQVTQRDVAREGINLEPTTDYMPQMGSMVGYAVTVAFEPSKREHVEANPNAWSEYQRYVASQPGPKIVIVQDLDKPNCVGAFWGEVNANVHRALGCVGTVTDGGVRDLEEMCYAGFKVLAARLCVGHGYSTPLRWGEPVEVFGRRVEPGQLIHADKHGFLAVPREDEQGLLEAARFMDGNECRTLIPAARGCHGLDMEGKLERIGKAADAFGQAVREKFGGKGEW
jgi:regulator of RNase E activity RraA